MKNFEQEIDGSLKTAKRVENEDGDKWECLQSLIESKEQFDAKVIEVVKGGCITYLENTHTFIPASQLSSSCVEKLGGYADRHITVIVITTGPEKERLVLSHRTIEQEEKGKEEAARLAELKVGDMLGGKVESPKDYGAFIDPGGAAGLLRISQISKRRVKTPADVLREDREVKVKIIKTGDGKISLFMRALEKPDSHFGDRNDTLEETSGFKYEEKTHAATNLDDLLKNIKL